MVISGTWTRPDAFPEEAYNSLIYPDMFFIPLYLATGKKISVLLHKPNKYLDILMKLLEDGKVKLIIDKCYPLSEVAEALRYFGEGHAKGKVVITLKEYL